MHGSTLSGGRGRRGGRIFVATAFPQLRHGSGLSSTPLRPLPARPPSARAARSLSQSSLGRHRTRPRLVNRRRVRAALSKQQWRPKVRKEAGSPATAPIGTPIPALGAASMSGRARPQARRHPAGGRRGVRGHARGGRPTARQPRNHRHAMPSSEQSAPTAMRSSGHLAVGMRSLLVSNGMGRNN